MAHNGNRNEIGNNAAGMGIEHFKCMKKSQNEGGVNQSVSHAPN